MKWVQTAHGSVKPCPMCADTFGSSGLLEKERQLTWDDFIDVLPSDTTGVHFALKWAGRRLVESRFGFATVHGNYGTAKSMFGKIIVAEACRARLPAKYMLGKNLESMLFRNNDSTVENKELQAAGDVFSFLDRFRVLVVDECGSMNWRNSWVAGELMRFFEDRSRGAHNGSHLTVLIGQQPPARWGPSEHLGALVSRCLDGSFGIPWHGPDAPPSCLLSRPCFCGRGTMKAKGKATDYVECPVCGSSREVEVYWPFGLDLSDIRPVLPSLYRNVEEVSDENLAAVFA